MDNKTQTDSPTTDSPVTVNSLVAVMEAFNAFAKGVNLRIKKQSDDIDALLGALSNLQDALTAMHDTHVIMYEIDKGIKERIQALEDKEVRSTHWGIHGEN